MTAAACAALPFDLVLFDLDGTLIETGPEIADAVNDTLGELQLAPVDEAQVARWIGHGTRELLIQALAHRRGVAADAVRQASDFADIESRFAAHYGRRCGTRSRLYPHVRQVLTELRAARVRLVVVTNKESAYTERVLASHQLADAFDRVISGDTLPVKKPNPLAVQDCLQRFAVAPARALFVGDSAIDVATARAAGVPVWCVPYGYNAGEPIAESQPDRIIPDFGALYPQALTALCRDTVQP